MGRRLCVGLLLCGMSAAAIAVEHQHGYAFLADPKYPPDFTHYDYVNSSGDEIGFTSTRGVGAL